LFVRDEIPNLEGGAVVVSGVVGRRGAAFVANGE